MTKKRVTVYVSPKDWEAFKEKHSNISKRLRFLIWLDVNFPLLLEALNSGNPDKYIEEHSKEIFEESDKYVKKTCKSPISQDGQ